MINEAEANALLYPTQRSSFLLELVFEHLGILLDLLLGVELELGDAAALLEYSLTHARRQELNCYHRHFRFVVF